MNYQVLVEDTDVHIRILDPHPGAVALFSKAKDQYVEEYEGGAEIRERLNAIQFGQINDVRTKFSELELGMQNV